MCGIIGIVGKEPVADRLVDGLRRMEYRGYDSAGVCTLDDGTLIRRRAEGILPLWETEKQAIEDAIESCGGNIPKAAALLGISASTIYRKRQHWETLEAKD